MGSILIVIRTFDDTLSVEEVALGYKQLIDIEGALRMIKFTHAQITVDASSPPRVYSCACIAQLAILLVRIVESVRGCGEKYGMNCID